MNDMVRLRGYQGADEVNARGVSYKVNRWGVASVPAEDVPPLLKTGGFSRAVENDPTAPNSTIEDCYEAARHLPKGRARDTLMAICEAPIRWRISHNQSRFRNQLSIGDFQMTSSATFVGVKPGMDFGNGLRSDGLGVMTVPTGLAGGASNAGDAVMAAIRAGGVPLPSQTAGYATAKAAAVTAIAAIAATPTQAQI